MSASSWTAVAALVVVSWGVSWGVAWGASGGAAGPYAQGLADTARRAASAREGRPTVKLTGKDLPTLDRFEAELRQVVLTDDRFWKYVHTRRQLLDMRVRDAATDQALLIAERDTRDPLAVEHVLLGNVRTLAVLDLQRMPAREYVLVETAFRRALTDASLADEQILRLPPVRATNANYIREQDDQIKGMLEFQWRQLEERLEWMRKVRR